MFVLFLAHFLPLLRAMEILLLLPLHVVFMFFSRNRLNDNEILNETNETLDLWNYKRKRFVFYGWMLNGIVRWLTIFVFIQDILFTSKTRFEIENARWIWFILIHFSCEWTRYCDIGCLVAEALPDFFVSYDSSYSSSTWSVRKERILSSTGSCCDYFVRSQREVCYLLNFLSR